MYEEDDKQPEVTPSVPAASRTGEFPGAARAICESCKEAIGAATGYIALVGTAGAHDDLLFYDSERPPGSDAHVLPMPMRGLTADAHELNRAVAVNDMDDSDLPGLMPPAHMKIENVLLAPLCLNGQVVGVLGLANKPGGFDDADVSVATAFGDVAAVALRNARAMEQLHQSERDLMDRIAEAQEAAERERANTRLYLDAAGALLLGIGVDRRVRFANRALCQLLELGEAEIVGRNWLEIALPTDDRERTEHLLELLTEGKCGSFVREESPLKTPRGDRLIAWRHTVASDEHGGTIAIVSSGEDVTDQRMAELRLREMQERLQLAVAAGNIGLWDWNLVTDETYFSPESKYILGFQAHEISNSLSEWTSRIHPEDLIDARAMFEACATAPCPAYPTEFRTLHKDGSYRWIGAHAASLGDEQGGVIRILGSFVDVTELRRSERASQIIEGIHRYARNHTHDELLREALDQLCELLESPIGFLHFVEPDEHSIKLQAWSTRTTSEFCSAEAPGLHYDLDRAGVWADCVRERRPIIHNDYASLPNRKGLPKGHAPVVRECVVPIFRSNRIVAVLGLGNKPSDYTIKDAHLAGHIANVAWEVAARKRSDLALLESEERFRLSMEFSPYPQVLIRDGIITFINEAGLTLFGATRAEIIGSPLIDRIHPDLRQRAAGSMQRLSVDHGAMPLTESKVLRMDGTSVDVEVTAAAIDMPQGPTIEAVFRDITKRKLNELENQRHRRRLSELAGQLLRTSELERRRVAVELHDGVGQALAAAKLSAKQITSTPEAEIDSELSEQLITALETAIDGVRAITSELSPPLLHAFGLGAALERLTETYMHRYGLMCEVSVEPEVGKLQNDSAVLLHRAATELLNNVHRHSGTRSARLELAGEGDEVILSVTDRGRGFSAAKALEHDASNDSFGLFSIQEEVGLVGGTLSIESAPGRGSRIEVRIPRDLDWSSRSADDDGDTDQTR